VGTAVPNEGWLHVKEGTDIEYGHNPPTSGTHFPRWETYEVHDDVVPRGNYVHNLEHGGVVLLFRPDAPEARIAELKSFFDKIPADPECGHKRALVTADPLLDDDVAAVVADYAIEGDDVTEASVLELVEKCRNQAPEDVCLNGGEVPFNG
jgi:hypothetical protein